MRVTYGLPASPQPRRRRPRRSQPLAVDLDVPFLVRLDPRLLQADAVGVRRTAAGDEQVRPFDLRVASVQADGLAGSPLDAIDGCPGQHLDPLVQEEPLDRLGDVRVLAVDQRAVPLDDGHPATEAAERLGQLEADVAAAQDDQVSRELAQLKGLDVGQRASLRESSRVVHPVRFRPGVDEDGLTAERPGPARVERPCFDRHRRDESPMATDDELSAPLSRYLREVHFDQSMHHPPLAVADDGHVDLPVAVGDPELLPRRK